MNAIFMPMFIQGLAGLNRRLYDGGITYSHAHGLQKWNVVQGWSAWTLGLFQLLFIANVIVSLRRGRRASDNPWAATTLEWTTATPPPHENFARIPTVYRGAYEYSVPGAARDFIPQDYGDDSAAMDRRHQASAPAHAAIPYTATPRPDTGVNNVKFGVWLFLASEVMLFGGLFSAYFMLRDGALAPWRPLSGHLGTAGMNTGLLVAAGAIFGWSVRLARRGQWRGARAGLLAASSLALAFIRVKLFEYSELTAQHLTAAASTQLATYFLLTGVHLLHVAGGLVVNVRLLLVRPSRWTAEAGTVVNRLEAVALYWYFVDAVWLMLVVLLYLV